MKKRRTSFFKEFLDFINKGNIFDMAIGIIIGNAFTKIVNSLVNDVVMPLVSNLIKIDITTAKLVLQEEKLDEAGEVIVAGIYLNYGSFIQNILNFLIIAFAIFFAIKSVAKIKDAYARYQIKYIKMLKKKHPEFFDEDDEPGTLLYEKLKSLHPEAFETEEAKKVEEKKEVNVDQLEVNNKLLTKINEKLEMMSNQIDK